MLGALEVVLALEIPEAAGDLVAQEAPAKAQEEPAEPVVMVVVAEVVQVATLVAAVVELQKSCALQTLQLWPLPVAVVAVAEVPAVGQAMRGLVVLAAPEMAPELPIQMPVAVAVAVPAWAIAPLPEVALPAEPRVPMVLLVA
jgi:hypothetical protein